MDAISLPVVSSADAPKKALRVMADHKRSAIVVDSGGSYSLVFGGAVAKARRDGILSVDQISAERLPLHPISNQEHQTYGVSVLRPLSTGPQFEGLLESVHSQYGILSITKENAIVITAHETLGDDLVLQGAFECDGTVVHYYPRPRVDVGDRCPSCKALGITSTIAYVR